MLKPAFVEYRRYGFFAKAVVPALVGVMEKIKHGGILNRGEDTLAIYRVREEFDAAATPAFTPVGKRTHGTAKTRLNGKKSDLNGVPE